VTLDTMPGVTASNTEILDAGEMVSVAGVVTLAGAASGARTRVITFTERNDGRRGRGSKPRGALWGLKQLALL
jgi:hypothetical protein